MSKRLRIAIVGIGLLVVGAYFAVPRIYRFLDAGYQRNMDPIRIKHAKSIVAAVLTYADKTGHFPFAERAKDRPFMIVIGHSAEAEDSWANDPVLRRGGRWSNSSELEAELSKELGQAIRLPRDPQRVPTYAPNVYVYYLVEDQMTVAVHLFEPNEETVEYKWRDGQFHSYTLTFAAKK